MCYKKSFNSLYEILSKVKDNTDEYIDLSILFMRFPERLSHSSLGTPSNLLSILFMRFQTALYPFPSPPPWLSILFMRFLVFFLVYYHNFMSFNSLYEILIYLCITLQTGLLNLSILFMRFLKSKKATYYELEYFQFSLWDSTYVFAFVSSRSERFQFSLWDSTVLTKQKALSLWVLSILFMRFTKNTEETC